MLSNILITYFIQSDREIGVRYTAECDEDIGVPIKPAIQVIGTNNDAVHNLANGIFDLAIFESLRIQVWEGKGISCLFRNPNSGSCCGKNGLLWGIYEAGLKAMEELCWQPTQWVEPECDKPNKK